MHEMNPMSFSLFIHGSVIKIKITFIEQKIIIRLRVQDESSTIHIVHQEVSKSKMLLIKTVKHEYKCSHSTSDVLSETL